MKRSLTTLTLAALLGVHFGAPALAQREAPVRRGEIFQRLDLNQDGRLDERERAAARDGLRRRAESRRGGAERPAPRARRGTRDDARERSSCGRGEERGPRGAAPLVRGPLGRHLERRFGNGDGRVGPMERMRLRRLAERWRSAGEAQRPRVEGPRRADGPRPESPRGGGRAERGHGETPDVRGEDF